MTNTAIESELQSIANQLGETQLVVQERVQSLWKGYGEILRLWLPKAQKTVVAKWVSPPELGKQATDAERNGHTRKVHSFEVERFVYQNLSMRCSELCKSPTLLATNQSHSVTNSIIIVMEDLDSSGFHLRGVGNNVDEVSRCLHWLAHFHAEFFGEEQCQPALISNLWYQGNYWHLATRKEEWAVMSESPLKSHAQDIADKLANAAFKTVIHGDSKLANFCFNSTSDRVAAVDFQYCGLGSAVTDVMILLSSSLSEPMLLTHAQGLFDDYIACFQSAMKARHPAHNTDAIEVEYRSLWPFAWADYQRFLAGWKPGHFRVNQYMQQQTELALSIL